MFVCLASGVWAISVAMFRGLLGCALTRVAKCEGSE
jgi:hypothetical protein